MKRPIQSIPLREESRAATRTASPPLLSREMGRHLARHNWAMARLVVAVQELSLARDLETVMKVVRRAARELTGADGATFVLRDRDHCFYAEEDAIGPLWKGQRFPMSICVSGWAMTHRKPAAIEDVFDDPRVPADVYRKTFVKSLVMVPIRAREPIGAIGNYWARRHKPSRGEVELLQALADTTSVAMESVRLYAELEQRVRERTLQLEAANKELEAFSYAVSHDLHSPLTAISGFAELLQLTAGESLPGDAGRYLGNIASESFRMKEIIDDLLRLARVSKTELRREELDLGAMARTIGERLRASAPGRRVEFRVAAGLEAWGDHGLIRAVLENLLSNAWKYSSKRETAVVEVGRAGNEFFVRDNGAGFDMRQAGKLFAPFHRLHKDSDFAGTGVGLNTVQRILERHGGGIRAEAGEGKGAAFFFTLPERAASLPGR